MRNTQQVGLAGVVILLALITPQIANAEEPPEILWVDRVDSSDRDEFLSVAVDLPGNVYFGGNTFGELAGQNQGACDAIIGKYDSTGNLCWRQQFGGTNFDSVEAIAIDGAGNVYSVVEEGVTGQPLIAKHDTDGNLAWTASTSYTSDDVTLDAEGNLYTVGNTGFNGSAFLTKHDTSGSPLWTWSGAYWGRGVATDGAERVYFVGSGTEPGGDPNTALVSGFDSDGRSLWTRYIAGRSACYDVAVDGLGSVYVAGVTRESLGAPNAGESDLFLAKYAPNGDLDWITQIGTPEGENPGSLALDPAGNVYLAGESYGSLGGANAGKSDIVLSKFDPAGNLLWTTQYGTTEEEDVNDLAVDTMGRAYLAGRIGGYDSYADAFVIAYAPEPSALAQLSMLAIGIALGWWRRRRSA